MNHSNKLIVMLLLTLSPSIASAADTFNNWVPNGWRMFSQATGDLNNDGKDDAVLIIEENNPDKIIKDPKEKDKTYNTNPRTLIVLFSRNERYEKVISRSDLLPTEGNINYPCQKDLLAGGGVSINKGKILFTLANVSNCGTGLTSTDTFTFRHDHNDDFELIGRDSLSFSKKTGAELKVSINYLTQKVKVTAGGNIYTHKQGNDKWSKISPVGLSKISTFKIQCFGSSTLGCEWSI
ncbi:MAG: hypothetical protein ACRCUB_12245 [Plesiomonas shigelloides]